ncbi:hypothetical protein N7G274_009709 [Stereocaulon virgatum]|uniref:Uncharacterized protein n=1 Tax=Stereocaulon virgatum TaxID=373712 RepID=A0ABR3ZY12_9LECA
MGDYNPEESYRSARSQSPNRPGTRSRVTEAPPNLQNDDVEMYHRGQQVYLHTARGSDINPYKIHQCLGNGQYKLERNGRVEKRPYDAANLSTCP